MADEKTVNLRLEVMPSGKLNLGMEYQGRAMGVEMTIEEAMQFGEDLQRGIKLAMQAHSTDGKIH